MIYVIKRHETWTIWTHLQMQYTAGFTSVYLASSKRTGVTLILSSQIVKPIFNSGLILKAGKRFNLCFVPPDNWDNTIMQIINSG